MHILIIEDEKRNFNRLKRLLEEIDGTFRIDGPLASIVEAVEWLQAHPAPELIFADIRLSDGLSFDVLRRTAVPSPVIFTTAYDEYAIQAFKYNSFDYLLKPVKADELAAAMEKVQPRKFPADKRRRGAPAIGIYAAKQLPLSRAFSSALPRRLYFRAGERYQPHRFGRTQYAPLPEQRHVRDRALFSRRAGIPAQPRCLFPRQPPVPHPYRQYLEYQ